MAIDPSSTTGANQHNLYSPKLAVSSGNPKNSVSSEHIDGSVKARTDGNTSGQAHMFNENGFFGNIRDQSGPGAFSEIFDKSKAGREPAIDMPQADATVQTSSENNAEFSRWIVQAARTMTEDQFRAFMADILTEPGKGARMQTIRIEGGSKSKVPMAESAPQISGPNLAALSGDSNAPPIANNAVQDSEAPSSSEPLPKAKIAPIINPGNDAQSNSAVSVAVRELDTGLKIVTLLGGLKKQDRQEIRAIIAGVLAQHGFGQYDLLLNGSLHTNLFSKR